MDGAEPISGFSRLSREEKIEMASKLSSDPEAFVRKLAGFWHRDPEVQRILEEFSENTVSNYCLPFGLAPNFLINDRLYILPMVIEESSVVAAASKSAKFWVTRGGFQTEVISTAKPGHVYFKWKVSRDLLLDQEEDLERYLIEHTAHLTENMRKRGGGIKSVRIHDMAPGMPGHFKLEAIFETADSMGANFINTCLEAFAGLLPEFFHEQGILIDEYDLEITMAILSNHTPECIVSCKVQCPEEEFAGMGVGLTAGEFIGKFKEAVNIARHDPYRAVTHNKGIFNGVDALVLATGNDYRAIEAAGHAYASREGKYSSLTGIELSGGNFTYSLHLPMAIGTVGGLTGAHPLARLSMELLGFPDAGELMQITAAAGMSNHFAAIWSLVTSGIQKGHMHMHLSNILNSLGATVNEMETASRYFHDKDVSYRAVEDYLIQLRRSL
ncbi:MAG: hydroxymethylglutaryl-CoA reductase [Bacteroidales bacterium]|nr:hydroxymethylglutaryl-CoA reductase [Bacteroidales bacterium]